MRQSSSCLSLLAALPQLFLRTGAPGRSAGWLQQYRRPRVPMGSHGQIVDWCGRCESPCSCCCWTGSAHGISAVHNLSGHSISMPRRQSQRAGRARRGASCSMSYSAVHRDFPRPLGGSSGEGNSDPEPLRAIPAAVPDGLFVRAADLAADGGREDADSFFRTNYLTIVSAYALMLLGDVCFWNSLRNGSLRGCRPISRCRSPSARS